MAEKTKISSSEGKPLRSTTGKPLTLFLEGCLPTGKPVLPENGAFQHFEWFTLSTALLYIPCIWSVGGVLPLSKLPFQKKREQTNQPKGEKAMKNIFGLKKSSGVRCFMGVL